jgi:hypothetical protein
MLGIRILVRHVVKSFSGCDIDGMIAGVTLPTLDCGIDMNGIELDTEAGTPGAFRGY